MLRVKVATGSSADDVQPVASHRESVGSLFDRLALLFCEPGAAALEHDTLCEGEVRDSRDADLPTDGSPELEPPEADNGEDQ